MRNFIVKFSIFTIICLSLFYLIFFLADGYSDGLYLKFTSPKQSSLIIGTSKATQGLQPKILNKELNRNDIYNYAFTVMHSPYGPVYLESIRKKLNKDTKAGLFILQIDPYSISSKTLDPNDIKNFRENEGAVGRIQNVNIRPNLEYMIWHYPYQYIFIYKRRLDAVGHGFLHEDGWLEMQVPMENELMEKRIKSKYKAYLKRTNQYQFSTKRYDYLKKLVKFLQRNGQVVLVRLPVHKSLLELENELIPDFDNKMELLEDEFKVPYFNYSEDSQRYLYTDGNHLHKESGREISKRLAKDIKMYYED